ncbi:MAG: flippase-like domain-containing protein [Flavobacteriales bacterium]|nr:flippase-like domain-containing protein [Flavobacteriales bacterium]
MIRSEATGLLLIVSIAGNAHATVQRTLLLLFRLGIFAWACVYLVAQLRLDESSTLRALVASGGLLSGSSASGLLIVALLMVVNWGLEAFKWRFLVKPLEHISVLKAVAATLAGCSVSLVTPNRTGEFVGRVLYLRPEQRIAGASLTVLGNLSQVLVTFVLGSLGLLFMVMLELPLPVRTGWPLGAVAVVVALFTLVAAVLFLFPQLLRHTLDLVPFLRRFDHHFRVLSELPRSALLTTLALSGVRYMVFTAQFVALLVLLGTDVPLLHMVLAVPVIFLLTTLVPTFMLTELGVRGGVALALLQPLGGAPLTVVAATSLLWSLNVLLPALLGSVLLLLGRSRSSAA